MLIDMEWTTALILLILLAVAVYGLVRLSSRKIDREWSSRGEFGP